MISHVWCKVCNQVACKLGREREREGERGREREREERERRRKRRERGGRYKVIL
jgi:hypothetical protein